MNLEGPKASIETAKQIITLSTGAIAFTVTFIENFKVSVGGAHSVPKGLYVSWVLFGLSTGFALWYLMALNGNISAIARKENGWELTPAEALSAAGDEGNTLLPGWLMMGSFLLAVGSLIWIGFAIA
jgi:hypothetical protein